MEIPYTVDPRPETGLYNAKLGIWLFLASEVMLFGGSSRPTSFCAPARRSGPAARHPERPARLRQHARAHHFERHDGPLLGLADDEKFNRYRLFMGLTLLMASSSS